MCFDQPHLTLFVHCNLIFEFLSKYDEHCSRVTQSLFTRTDVFSHPLRSQPVHVEEEELLVDVDLATALEVQPVENVPDLGEILDHGANENNDSYHLLGPGGARTGISNDPNVLLSHLDCRSKILRTSNATFRS